VPQQQYVPPGNSNTNSRNVVSSYETSLRAAEANMAAAEELLFGGEPNALVRFCWFVVSCGSACWHTDQHLGDSSCWDDIRARQLSLCLRG
jgi:hypothetical protein